MSLTRRTLLGAGLVSLVPGVANAALVGQQYEKDANGEYPYNENDINLIDEEYRRQLVEYRTDYPAGTIVVDPSSYFLYQTLSDTQALRYGVGVGRAGFEWKGEAIIARKARWPGWWPPADMRKRQPYLPKHVPGGPNNPLGARALYLYQNGRDTLYRIHGTNEPQTIGLSVSSGCIRIINVEVIDLYRRVPVGTKVVVL